MRCLWWAIALAACGDVQKVPDAAVPDAYQPDSPQEVTCGPGEMACNGVCTNPMSDELYCGNCNTQCSPTQGCVNGTCVPANTTCVRVREIEPTAPDGAYRNPNTGAVFYCDYTNGKEYEFGIGQYNVPYFGYTLMSVASFDEATQVAFLAVYNLIGGFATIAPFTSGLCCITQSNNNELNFGGTYLSLALNGTNACNINYNGVYQLMRGQQTPYTPPLPADFFTTNPVTEAASCGDTNNIGLFMKTTTF